MDVEFRSISIREHWAFLGLTVFGFAMRLFEILWSTLTTRSDPGASFGIYDIFDMWDMVSPLYSLIGFFICAICAIRLTIPTLTCSLLPLGLLVFFFDRWFIDSRRLVQVAADLNPAYQLKTFDFAVVGGSFFDFLTLLIVNLLILWQLSLLIRLIRGVRT